MELVLPSPKTEQKRDSVHSGPTVVAVLSGKGGVGKTVVSTNLAVALASDENGILLVDCDIWAGQSHLVLGLCPAGGLAQVVRGEKKLKQILVSVGDGLILAPGGPSGGSALDLRGRDITRLLAEARISAPSARAVILDAGPAHRGTLGDFAGAADIPLVVCTPEPTAVRATVAILELILTERPGAKPHLLVNMAASEQDASRCFETIRDALLPVFMSEVSLLGWLPDDGEVTRSLLRCSPVVKYSPNSGAARGLNDLKASLAGLMRRDGRPSTGVDEAGTDEDPGTEQDGGDQARAA